MPALVLGHHQNSCVAQKKAGLSTRRLMLILDDDVSCEHGVSHCKALLQVRGPAPCLLLSLGGSSRHTSLLRGALVWMRKYSSV